MLKNLFKRKLNVTEQFFGDMFEEEERLASDLALWERQRRFFSYA